MSQNIAFEFFLHCHIFLLYIFYVHLKLNFSYQDPKEKAAGKKKAAVKPDPPVKQPSIKQFFNMKKENIISDANDELIEEITKDVNKINLQPKKLVMTTKTNNEKVKIYLLYCSVAIW